MTLAKKYEDGERYVVTECMSPDGSTSRTEAWVPRPGPAGLTALQIAQIEAAVKEMVLPLPHVRSWPPLDRQVVGIETWLHVDGGDTGTALPFAGMTPVTDGLTVGDVTVQASAVVVGPVRWDFGSDTSGRPLLKECQGPGEVWETGADERDPQRCAFRFYEKKAGTATVAITYDVTWTATTGQTGVVPGLLRSAMFPIRVREIEAVGRG